MGKKERQAGFQIAGKEAEVVRDLQRQIQALQQKLIDTAEFIAKREGMKRPAINWDTLLLTEAPAEPKEG